MDHASGSLIKKTLLYTARMRESDAADIERSISTLGKCERSRETQTRQTRTRLLKIFLIYFPESIDGFEDGVLGGFFLGRRQFNGLLLHNFADHAQAR
jgi:hypothetical protein